MNAISIATSDVTNGGAYIGVSLTRYGCTKKELAYHRDRRPYTEQYDRYETKMYHIIIYSIPSQHIVYITV